MNKKPELMEKMIALVMLAYCVGLLTGEGIRDAVYAQHVPDSAKVSPLERIPDQPQLRQGQKWKLYSGLFILLKQTLDISRTRRRKICHQVLPVFKGLVQHPVRTHV